MNCLNFYNFCECQECQGKEVSRGFLRWFKNSVTFSGKPIRSEVFLNQMVETLGITVDRRPKERLRRMESRTIEKIGCIPVFNKK